MYHSNASSLTYIGGAPTPAGGYGGLVAKPPAAGQFFVILLKKAVLTLFVPGGQICPPFSYFNITPKRKQSFALMHPDFKSNLITNIFRKFGVSRTTGSDVIFAFVRGT